jgi:hypothetical protein
VLRVPVLKDATPEEGRPCSAAAARRPLTLAARLGAAALALGLLAVLVLCLPLVGYASLILSGGGLVLGLWGVARSVHEDAGAVGNLLGGPEEAPASPSRPTLTYPLAGVLACLLALSLALLPFLWGA